MRGQSATSSNDAAGAPSGQQPFHYPAEWEGAHWGPRGHVLSKAVMDVVQTIGALIWIGAVALLIGHGITAVIDRLVGL